MGSNIAIIDLDSVIFTAFHPNKVLDEDGNPLKANNKFVYKEKTEQEVLDSCDSLMNMILRRSKATHYICYVKGKQTTVERLAVHTDYKANRIKLESPKYWGLCKDHFMSKWNAIEANNYEVDDYVNVTYRLLPESYIVAIDKDLLSLKTRDKYHYNWRLNKWIEVDETAADYKFWTDMIVGQSGDNIKGIPGKGEKYAEKMLSMSILIDDTYYRTVVLNEYVKHFGEAEGIKEFYKNYTCLKIKDEIAGFELPEINEYKVDSAEDNSKYLIDF